MMLNGFPFICAVVATLHLAALGFACGPVYWKYVLTTVASGGILWGVIPALVSLRHWSGLFIGAAVALALQQVAFWLWRVKLGGIWCPLAQFASVHFLIALGLGRLRQRRPATFVWRDRMLKQRR